MNSSLTKKRWIILAASCLINLCIGSLYAWSVFSGPLAAKFSELSGTPMEAASLSIIFTIANAVGPITMISGGTINDKIGPKWVIFAGGILFGLGMLGSGFVTSVPALMVTYGLGCGLGVGLAYGCTISNSVKFFPDKRGLIGGIATATYGLSSVIIPPIANAMITGMGIGSTMKVLGIAFIVIICVSSMFIEKCPAGFVPDGFTAPGAAAGGAPKIKDKSWKEMISDPVFFIMLLMLMCGAFSGLMITSQASPMAQKLAGMTPALAATAVSVLALFNAAGRVCAGFLSDKLGRVNVLRAAFLLEIVGLFLLLSVKEGASLQLMAGVSIMGICFGALMGVYPGFTADQFGAKNNSVNYGIMFIGFAVAGYLGPTVVSKIVRSTGTYNMAFITAGALAVAGIVLSFAYGVLSKKRK